MLVPTGAPVIVWVGPAGDGCSQVTGSPRVSRQKRRLLGTTNVLVVSDWARKTSAFKFFKNGLLHPIQEGLFWLVGYSDGLE